MPVSTQAALSDNNTAIMKYYLGNWGHSDMGRVQFNSRGVGSYHVFEYKR